MTYEPEISRVINARTMNIIGILTVTLVGASSTAGAGEFLPAEEVNFGYGEIVPIRAREIESTKWVIGREFGSQYDDLAKRAKAGDAEVAENLATALTRCETAPRSEAELNAATELMRAQRKLLLPDGRTADIRSDSETETLVWQLIVEPYEVCDGLTDGQRASAKYWRNLAVELGNVDAAVAALDVSNNAAEQQSLRLMVWGAGEPAVLGAEARFYLDRAKTAEARPNDLVDAYAYQFALNEIAEFFARHYPPRPIRQRVHDEIAKQLDSIGVQLSAEQREAAVKQAARIVRSNPNCCSIL